MFKSQFLCPLVLLLGCLISQVSAVTITTANGAGADAEVTEDSNASFDSGNGTSTAVNARYSTDRNEYVALRFDLTGQSMAGIADASLELVNFRTNGTGRVLRFYGVAAGTVGKDGNGVIRGYTAENWTESDIRFSTLPGVDWDGNPVTRSLDTPNLTELGAFTPTVVNEGTTLVFSNATLATFLQSHLTNRVTILIMQESTNSGQFRFATKETTTTLSSIVTGAAGDFAPRLNFTVNVAPDVSGIYFNQQPSGAPAGSVIAPAVTIVATNLVGAPATNVTVTLSLASGTGPLNGTLSQLTDAGGVATFSNLSLTAVGTKQLFATAGSLTATSSNFAIGAGPAAALTISTQPSNVGINKPITPPVVVQLLDAYGNSVASNGIAITMALTSGTGTLSGNTNIATDGTGKSTFTNLSLNFIGTKTLTANRSGLSSAVSSSFQVTNVVVAFPGAEGAGALASGGRGGDVYYVTNLNDTGAGSLRNGISGAPAGGRTIVFKVSGNIALNSTLTINKPNITVAGQTAPGDGICIQDESFNIAANNVIVRHLRTRLGTNNLSESDGMWINSGTNIIVDHVSASWSVDETLSTSTDVANLTVQNCFITESLQNSIHAKGAHGYGGIISGASSTTYTYLRNLYAHNDSRNPRLGSDSQTGILRLDFRNNVVYNWGGRAGYSGDTNETTEMNYVGNYLIAGPSSSYNFAFLSGGNTTTIFQSGNFIDTDKDSVVDGANTGWSMFSGPETQLGSPLDVPVVNTDSAGTAYQRVLAQSGAMPWRRDACDQRIVRTVRTQKGQLVDFVNPTSFVGDYVTNNIGGTNYIGVNPWPTLSSSTAPLDFDNDGMPDFWEVALGFATNNAADRNVTNSSGYTRLEDYLNWLADPHALCNRNGYVDFDLRAANGGATNLTFTVANGTNGTAILLGDGFTARFTATNNFSGLANFTYTAVDPANSLGFGPAAVGILITTTNAPNTPPSLAAISNATLVAGTTLVFTNYATDAEAPPQMLTFSLLSQPTNATITTGTGIFSWRPTMAQGGSSNAMKVVVTDSGSPALSATQAFSVVVNIPVQPALVSGVSNGWFSLVVNGDTGPDYAVQASTNLVNWTTLTNVNAPVPPFIWSDPNSASFPQRFYRVILGP